MKKLLTIAIIGIFITSGFVVTATHNTNNEKKTISDSITLSKLELINTNNYVSIQLDETNTYIQEPGNPKIPLYVKTYVFPFGTQIKSVDCLFNDPKIINLDKPIVPTLEPVPVLVDAKKPSYTVNSEVYNSNNVFPKMTFYYKVGCGLKDDKHVVFLSVYCSPIRYKPIENKIFFSDEIKINVNFEETKSPLVFSDEYDLIVISPEEYTAELQPLVEHKISFGLNSMIKTTEDIYSEYSGRDEAEKIKYFIKDAIETLGAEYILLVGSIRKLPIRSSDISIWRFEDDVLTDLYYADIYDHQGMFCSWDYNENDIFGEPNVDQVDLYPDVYLGRLACDTLEEVIVVVNKIIHYETETFGESWFNDMVFIGGDTFPWWPGNEGENLNEIIMGIMSDFNPSSVIWTSKRNFNRPTISRAISQGAGFVDYSGHGFEHGMGTYPPNNGLYMKSYLTFNVNDISNGYKLPIIFFDACLTAKLDFVLRDVLEYKQYRIFYILSMLFNMDIDVELPVFAWYFVKHDGGGAIATIGATRTAYGGVEEGAGKISVEFFNSYEGSEFLGQMMTGAQNVYIQDVPDDAFTVEEFILLGDPSLKIGGYQ